ncbi:MAG: replication protein [Candidatus Arsenophonus phytopathogenicus]
MAEIENGYTRIANGLYEELISSDLTRNQAKVAHAVCRKTYGFHKEFDRISDSQLSELTKLPRQKANKAKNELIAMNVLIKLDNKIALNKTISEWKVQECHQNSDNLRNVTKSVTALSPKQGHTKETITKEKRKYITPIIPLKKSEPKKDKFDISQEPIPHWLNKSVWQDWLDYRKGLKKPIKTRQTFNGQIKLLTECHEFGYSPEEVLNRSITNGWQGLFKLNGNQVKKHRIQDVEKLDIFISEDF